MLVAAAWRIALDVLVTPMVPVAVTWAWATPTIRAAAAMMLAII